MPLLRKIFFYLFVLVYLIICPVIILRMLGFVMDPRTRHWVKTGIIYVSSNPPGAAITINGRRAQETTPTIIRDLAPGQYTLRMELDGYGSWENQVPVVDKKATSVDNILLIPKQWKTEALNDSALTKLVPIPGNNYLLVAPDDIAQNISILRLNKDIEDNLEPLLPEESIYREARVVRYFTVVPSPFFVMEINLGDENKFLWMDPRDKQVHIEDLGDLLPQTPQRLYWEPNDEKNIFAFYPNFVNRINIKAKAIYPNIDGKDIPIPKKLPDLSDAPKADQVYLINNGNTFLFRRGNGIFLMDQVGFGRPRLTKVLRVAEHTDVYFAEKTGKLYYIDEQSRFLSSIQILHHKPFIPKPIADTLRLKRLEQ
ncbi:MAG: PEGA domain-containing protein [Candidatus Omnitrophica bacterium]|nr:PEGA domain-containing protein [Candidatus Omnitrophota bacterium]